MWRSLNSKNNLSYVFLADDGKIRRHPHNNGRKHWAEIVKDRAATGILRECGKLRKSKLITYLSVMVLIAIDTNCFARSSLWVKLQLLLNSFHAAILLCLESLVTSILFIGSPYLLANNKEEHLKGIWLIWKLNLVLVYWFVWVPMAPCSNCFANHAFIINW